MSTDEPSFSTGETFSVALDPHRRESLADAIDVVYEDRGGHVDRVALLGWQAATLLDEVYERTDEVVIVEDDEELVDSIRQGLLAQDRGKKVSLVSEPPAEVSLEEPVDVAAASVTSTWFIEGEAADLLRNARRDVVADDGTMIPRRFLHLLELAAPPNDVGGMPLRTARFSRPGEPVPSLSESKHFTTTDLTDESGVPREVDDTIIVKPLVSGRLTALRLTTLCELADGVMQRTSQSGLQSILMPLREDIDIEAGQPVNIHLKYSPGSSLEETKFSARSLPDRQTDTWDFHDHPVTDAFREQIAEMIDLAKQRGRGEDLESVVQYTVEPHGDVSRLTAFFWTLDEEYRQPVREIVDEFRSRASEETGEMPGDEVVYELMLEVYRQKFDSPLDGET